MSRYETRFEGLRHNRTRGDASLEFWVFSPRAWSWIHLIMVLNSNFSAFIWICASDSFPKICTSQLRSASNLLSMEEGVEVDVWNFQRGGPCTIELLASNASELATTTNASWSSSSPLFLSTTYWKHHQSIYQTSSISNAISLSLLFWTWINTPSPASEMKLGRSRSTSWTTTLLINACPFRLVLIWSSHGLAPYW